MTTTTQPHDEYLDTALELAQELRTRHGLSEAQAQEVYSAVKEKAQAMWYPDRYTDTRTFDKIAAKTSGAGARQRAFLLQFLDILARLAREKA